MNLGYYCNPEYSNNHKECSGQYEKFPIPNSGYNDDNAETVDCECWCHKK